MKTEILIVHDLGESTGKSFQPLGRCVRIKSGKVIPIREYTKRVIIFDTITVEQHVAAVVNKKLKALRKLVMDTKSGKFAKAINR